jgi:hypothetical protein
MNLIFIVLFSLGLTQAWTRYTFIDLKGVKGSSLNKQYTVHGIALLVSLMLGFIVGGSIK